MLVKTEASLFTGGDLAGVGAIAAGYTPIWGIELDPDIAAVAQHNLGHPVYAQSVTDTDFSKLEPPDLLWASPPCPNFSNAKTNRKETDTDRAIARSVCDAIRILNPHKFILENVEGYRKSESFQGIVNTLHECGYWTNWQVLNAADFGVPQTRRRLILRAIRGGFLPELPLPVKWKGWYEAIADLIDTLPETEFAKWQIDRLPEELKTAWHPGEPQTFLTETKFPNRNANRLWHGTDEPSGAVTSLDPGFRAFLVDVGNTIRDCTVRAHDEPSITITAEKMRRPASTPRAFLVSGMANHYQQSVTITDGEGRSPSVTASDGKRVSRAWLKQGRVVRMTSRALARFQTLPDWYELPDKDTFACKIIGNGVPCLLAETVVRSLLSPC